MYLGGFWKMTAAELNAVFASHPTEHHPIDAVLTACIYAVPDMPDSMLAERSA